MIKTILLLPVIFLVVSLSALECFTRNGIAANFVDIQGKWCGTEQRVGITPLPEGLRFTFYTGVKNKDYNFIAKAKPDTPAVVGGGIRRIADRSRCFPGHLLPHRRQSCRSPLHSEKEGYLKGAPAA
jgi:hypothetical protein